jgi:tape measure domain-containing protein
MMSGGFATMLTGAVVADFARRTVDMADSMQNLRNKLGAVYDEQHKVHQGMLDIKRISQESRSQIDAVGTLYQRMAVATKSLGTEQEKVARLTQVVANSFIISGTTGSEAANSARQFAQGLASGTLRGDEFRSVSENNVYLTQMLAKGLNKTVGQLREFSHQGGLTAEVILDIVASQEKLNETNAAVNKMAYTLNQSMTIFANKVSMVADAINQEFGVLAKMGDVVRGLGDNLHILGATLAVLVVPAIVAFVTKGLVGIVVYGATAAANIALMGAKMLVVASSAGYAVGKFLLIPAVLGAGLTALIAFGDSLGLWKTETSKMFANMWDGIGNYLGKKIAEWVQTFKWMGHKIKAFYELMTGGGDGSAAADLAAAERTLANMEAASASAWARMVEDSKFAGAEIMSTFQDAIGAALPTGEGSIFANLRESILSIPEAVMGAYPALSKMMNLLQGRSTADEEGAVPGEGEEQLSPWQQFLESTQDLSPIQRLGEAVKGLKPIFAKVFDSAQARVKGMFNSMAGWEQVLGNFGKKSKKVAMLNSMLAMKEAIIQGKAAIMKAWNSAPFPANMGQVAITTARTAAVIGDIKAQMGQFHDGIDNVPDTGTYLLEKGERVVDSRLNGDLKNFLQGSEASQANSSAPITLQVNGVSDPDIVMEALASRRGELETMLRRITSDNLGSRP